MTENPQRAVPSRELRLHLTACFAFASWLGAAGFFVGMAVLYWRGVSIGWPVFAGAACLVGILFVSYYLLAWPLRCLVCGAPVFGGGEGHRKHPNARKLLGLSYSRQTAWEILTGKDYHCMHCHSVCRCRRKASGKRDPFAGPLKDLQGSIFQSTAEQPPPPSTSADTLFATMTSPLPVPQVTSTPPKPEVPPTATETTSKPISHPERPPWAHHGNASPFLRPQVMKTDQQSPFLPAEPMDQSAMAQRTAAPAQGAAGLPAGRTMTPFAMTQPPPAANFPSPFQAVAPPAGESNQPPGGRLEAMPAPAAHPWMPPAQNAPAQAEPLRQAPIAPQQPAPPQQQQAPIAPLPPIQPAVPAARPAPQAPPAAPPQPLQPVMPQMVAAPQAPAPQMPPMMPQATAAVRQAPAQMPPPAANSAVPSQIHNPSAPQRTSAGLEEAISHFARTLRESRERMDQAFDGMIARLQACAAELRVPPTTTPALTGTAPAQPAVPAAPPVQAVGGGPAAAHSPTPRPAQSNPLDAQKAAEMNAVLAQAFAQSGQRPPAQQPVAPGANGMNGAQGMAAAPQRPAQLTSPLPASAPMPQSQPSLHTMPPAQPANMPAAFQQPRPQPQTLPPLTPQAAPGSAQQMQHQPTPLAPMGQSQPLAQQQPMQQRPPMPQPVPPSHMPSAQPAQAPLPAFPAPSPLAPLPAQTAVGYAQQMRLPESPLQARPQNTTPESPFSLITPMQPMPAAPAPAFPQFAEKQPSPFSPQQSPFAMHAPLSSPLANGGEMAHQQGIPVPPAESAFSNMRLTPQATSPFSHTPMPPAGPAYPAVAAPMNGQDPDAVTPPFSFLGAQGESFQPLPGQTPEGWSDLPQPMASPHSPWGRQPSDS